MTSAEAWAKVHISVNQWAHGICTLEEMEADIDAYADLCVREADPLVLLVKIAQETCARISYALGEGRTIFILGDGRIFYAGQEKTRAEAAVLLAKGGTPMVGSNEGDEG